MEFRTGVKIRLGAAVVMLAATIPGAAQVPSQQTLRPLAVTQLDERQQGSDLESIRPLDITLSDPTPIVDLLMMLVRDTRLSVVPDPDVTGTFQGDLKQVTLRQALEMILQPRGYDYSVQGNLIRVFKRKVETRRFDLNYVVTRRSGSRTLSASNSVTPSGPGTTSDGSANSQGSSAQVSSVDGGDIFSDLAVGVQTLLSRDGKFNMDKKAAMLQATDYPDRLDQIQLYLEAVQNRATRQVQIQAKVIEVVLSEEFSAGINWNLVVHRAGNAVSVTQRVAPSSTGTITVGLNIKDFTGLLNALATQGKVNVMSSPRVNAMNNEPAIMRVGTQDVFFRRRQSQADGDRAHPADDGYAAVDYRGRRAQRDAADQRRRYDQHEHQPEHHRADRAGHIAPWATRCRFSACARPTRWSGCTRTRRSSSPA